MKFKGTLPIAEPSLSDWEWVREQIATDAPIPYDSSDPDDGPYDPNDDDAVDRFLTEENRVYPSAQTQKRPIPKAS